MRPILLRIRDGGKAGRREAGLKRNNSLSAGQSQSLLGSRCGSTAIHWRYPAPPCAEAARIRGHESVRGRLLSIEPSSSWATCRRGDQPKDRGLAGQSAQPSSRVSSRGKSLEGSCEFRSDSRREVMGRAKARAGRDLSKPISPRHCCEVRQEERCQPPCCQRHSSTGRD